MMLSRTYRLFLIGLMGIVLACPARAQSNDEQPGVRYFHTAAQQYIDSDLQQALATVNEGLQIDPGNPRLHALREKIRQQQQSGNRNDASEQNASRRESSAQQQNRAAKRDGASSSQQDASSDPQQQNEQKRAPESSPQNAPDSPQSSTEQPSSGEEPASERGGADNGPGLSRAQAARILRALENQEKQLLRQVQKRKRRSRRIEKEW